MVCASTPASLPLAVNSQRYLGLDCQPYFILMPGFKKYFHGKRDTGKSTSDAIVTLRQHLHTIEKKEEYLQKKIDEELKKAKANALVSEAGASCHFEVSFHTYI
jgi:hypothetical protein